MASGSHRTLFIRTHGGDPEDPDALFGGMSDGTVLDERGRRRFIPANHCGLPQVMSIRVCSS